MTSASGVLAGTTVGAVNGLTARWAGAASGDTVFSAAGVWPLLAFLADGAGGAARAELAEAVGLAGRGSGGRGAGVDGGPGRDAGAGFGPWAVDEADVGAAGGVGARAAAQTHGVLTGDEGADHAALDAWSVQRTGGLIERMPVVLTPDTELVLASALAMRTEWQHPFEEWPVRPQAGPWYGRTLLGLRRSSVLLDPIGVADTPEGFVTELKVPGTTGIDVHLLLGEERMTPGQVLSAGVSLLNHGHPVTSGSQLPYGEAGPGLRVDKERCMSPRLPTLDVTTMAYDMAAHHDLLELHKLFGLTTARDTAYGHFPGISGSPLAIGSAQQSTMARFGALGFRAAAVTAVAAAPGSARLDPGHVTTTIRAAFDRPFAFLAVHRTSRLVLAAGWVTDPKPYREDGGY